MKMKFLFFILPLSLAIDFPGDLVVSDNIDCDLFDVKNKITCDEVKTDTLNAENIEVKTIEATTLYTEKLIAQGQQIEVRGRIIMEGVCENQGHEEFLESEHFESFLNTEQLERELNMLGASFSSFIEVQEAPPTWREYTLTSLPSKVRADHHFDRPCTVVSKTIRGLPTHSEIRLMTNYHFTSGTWDGEAGFLLVNDQPVWIESFASPLKVAECDMGQHTTPVHAVFPHTGSDLTVVFGSSNPSDCETTFTVDPISIEFK